MERYRSLLERYVELYNAGDLDGVMDLYAKDSAQLMPDGTFEGRSAIHDRLAKELAAFSDIAHRYSATSSRAMRSPTSGCSSGHTPVRSSCLTAPSYLRPAKRVEVKGMELVRVRDGKIVLDNLYYDNLAVAAQLGLLPQSVPATD